MNKSLNKEMLYMLYVEEKMSDQEIALKYNEKPKEIKELRKKWNININQRFLADLEEIEKMYKKFKYKEETEEILQEYVGIPKSSDLYILILEILKDKNPHNIEEMWKISNKNYEVKEKEIPICGDTKNPTLYYRINWCIYKMLKDKVIQIEGKRRYIITERGIKKLNKERQIEEAEKIREQKEAEIDPTEQYKKLKEITGNSKVKQKRNQKEKSKLERNKTPRKIDFEKINREKINLGKFCENMVYLKERERIISEGREDLLNDILNYFLDEIDTKDNISIVESFINIAFKDLNIIIYNDWNVGDIYRGTLISDILDYIGFNLLSEFNKINYKNYEIILKNKSFSKDKEIGKLIDGDIVINLNKFSDNKYLLEILDDSGFIDRINFIYNEFKNLVNSIDKDSEKDYWKVFEKI